MRKNYIFIALLVFTVAAFAYAKNGDLASTSGKVIAFTHACTATPSFVQPAIPGMPAADQPKTYTEISCVASTATNHEVLIGDKNQLAAYGPNAGLFVGGDGALGAFPSSVTLSANVIGCMKFPGPVASTNLNCVAIYE